MTKRLTSWAPTPNGTFHALEDPKARPRRSLCGLRVEVDDSLISPGMELIEEKWFRVEPEPPHYLRPVRPCRSCLEKLEGKR